MHRNVAEIERERERERDPSPIHQPQTTQHESNNHCPPHPIAWDKALHQHTTHDSRSKQQRPGTCTKVINLCSSQIHMEMQRLMPTRRPRLFSNHPSGVTILPNNTRLFQQRLPQPLHTQTTRSFSRAVNPQQPSLLYTQG
jgi:hypothetical protein